MALISLMNPLTALSPIDGRYASKVDLLRPIVSEYGLIRYRLHVEIEWLICLASNSQIEELPAFSESLCSKLRDITHSFSVEDAETVKNIERRTNHDVKALEYFLKDRLRKFPEVRDSLEFVHFGCTSYDINDNCFGLMLKQSRDSVILPQLDTLVSELSRMADNYADLPMLGRTHGQPASPTTVGKELRVFVSRLENQIERFQSISIKGKLSGAVGNFNSLYAAYPSVEWPNIAQNFVESLGLDYNPITTQTEPHDYIAEYCHSVQRINSILLDLCRDVWGYISLGYFKQLVVESEVGSSAMPHKVNPIDFENAEGNLGIANSLFAHLAEKLPVSRWQRDLSDSTVLRALGVPIGHSLIAYYSVQSGLRKLEANAEKIDEELGQAWEVLSEAIQTVLRKSGTELPYEMLKQATRGVSVSKSSIVELIQALDIADLEKQELLNLTPQTYVGIAAKLAKQRD